MRVRVPPGAPKTMEKCMLTDQIKADLLTARKARDVIKSSQLSTLYSEATMIGKNDGNRQTTDLEVITLVKKTIGTLEDIITVVKEKNPEAEIEPLTMEIQLLQGYLPKQLSESELGTIIDGIIAANNITSLKQMGLVMKELVANHAGLFDGGVASNLVKSKLA